MVAVLLLAIVKVPVLLVIVSPLIDVADAAPSVGLVSVGLVAKTTSPDPVVDVTLRVPSPPDVVTIPFEVRLPSFLLVNDSAPSNVARVPEVGKVTEVLPLVANATVWLLEPIVVAPDVLRLPPTVIVEAPLLTPVPPLAAVKVPAMSEAGTVDEVVTAEPAVETFT